MGAFSRSWTITKLSFSVIGKDMEILLFICHGLDKAYLEC